MGSRPRTTSSPEVPLITKIRPSGVERRESLPFFIVSVLNTVPLIDTSIPGTLRVYIKNAFLLFPKIRNIYTARPKGGPAERAPSWAEPHIAPLFAEPRRINIAYFGD